MDGGKENLALARCCVSLKRDCSKDKKIAVSSPFKSPWNVTKSGHGEGVTDVNSFFVADVYFCLWWTCMERCVTFKCGSVDAFNGQRECERAERLRLNAAVEFDFYYAMDYSFFGAA